MVEVVVARAAAVWAKAGPKQRVRGWGRFTWEGGPAGGVPVTPQQTLEFFEESYLNDAVTPGAPRLHAPSMQLAAHALAASAHRCLLHQLTSSRL